LNKIQHTYYWTSKTLKGLRARGGSKFRICSHAYIGLKLCHGLTRIKKNGFFYHYFKNFLNNLNAFVTIRFSMMNYFNQLLIYVPTSCGHSIKRLWSGWWKVRWSSSSIILWNIFTRISTYLIIIVVIVILVFFFLLFLLF